MFSDNFFKEIVLTDYTEAQLVAIDPKLIVLASFTLDDPDDKDAVMLHTQRWKHILKTACTEQQYPNALSLLGIFLFDRCRHLSLEEVYNMLNINLLDSRAGQDIFAMGKQEGLQQGIHKTIISVLEARFNEIPETLKQRIYAIESEKVLMQLPKQVLLCQSLSELEDYLSA